VLNNPLKYTDPSGEFIFTALAIITGQWWALPMAIGADFGMWQGGTLANGGEMNPLKWDYSSGKTWGYMLGGAIVGGVSGYIGGAIAASDIPMANTLGIMGASFTNSVGTYAYTGGQTDISISFGAGSYDFTTGDWRGIWNWNDLNTMEKIGYGLGTVINGIDLYRYYTWDVLTREEQIAKLQEEYPNYTIKYDKTLTTEEGYYDSTTKTLFIGRKGLNKGFGWAKSTIDHEFKHYLDDINNYAGQAMKEVRAYTTELKNAAKNGLTYSQYRDIQMRLLYYLKKTGNNITIQQLNQLQHYTFKLWILSIVKR
jgi:hypothetical protein